jgi:phosphotransacetylase
LQRLGYDQAILIGRENVIQDKFKAFGISDIKITNAALSENTQKYVDHLYH